jgi:hypothetical protein
MTLLVIELSLMSSSTSPLIVEAEYTRCSFSHRTGMAGRHRRTRRAKRAAGA